MKRLSMYCVIIGLLLPAAAAAQVMPTPVPPVPPVQPVMPVMPVPPVAPVAPNPIAAPRPRPKIDGKPFGFNFDFDFPMFVDPEFLSASLQDSKEQARAMSEQARDMAQQAADQAREMQRAMSDSRFAFAQDSAGGGAFKGGLDALQQRQYDRAITAFDRVVAQKGDRADAALYWKAFAQFKLAQTTDALATIAQLRRDYAQSRYLNEAKVLEADARKMAGQPMNPASADDDEIKLLAIQGVSKSDQAVPLLEGVLNATNSLNVKKRALYVLALSDDTRAHAVLMRYAKGGGNPDLQIEAIRYLASRRDSKSTPTELREIYDGTQDVNVKMATIDAYRAWGDKAALVRISADKAATADVRRSAISRLNGLADLQDVMTLYQQEPDPALRMQLINVLAPMSATDQLVTIAKTDKDQGVKVRAVRVLGGQRNDKTTQALVNLYSTEQDKEFRRAVIQSLMGQNNAEALVSLAKKETDLDLKRDLVRRLSDMSPKSKAAADYMMEQLK